MSLCPSGCFANDLRVGHDLSAYLRRSSSRRMETVDRIGESCRFARRCRGKQLEADYSTPVTDPRAMRAVLLLRQAEARIRRHSPRRLTARLVSDQPPSRGGGIDHTNTRSHRACCRFSKATCDRIWTSIGILVTAGDDDCRPCGSRAGDCLTHGRTIWKRSADSMNCVRENEVRSS